VKEAARSEEIGRELRDADATLNAGKDLAAALQALEIKEATCLLGGTGTEA
jgi:hypothetical protein